MASTFFTSLSSLVLHALSSTRRWVPNPCTVSSPFRGASDRRRACGGTSPPRSFSAMNPRSHDDRRHAPDIFSYYNLIELQVKKKVGSAAIFFAARVRCGVRPSAPAGGQDPKGIYSPAPPVWLTLLRAGDRMGRFRFGRPARTRSACRTGHGGSGVIAGRWGRDGHGGWPRPEESARFRGRPERRAARSGWRSASWPPDGSVLRGISCWWRPCSRLG